MVSILWYFLIVNKDQWDNFNKIEQLLWWAKDDESGYVVIFSEFCMPISMGFIMLMFHYHKWYTATGNNIFFISNIQIWSFRTGICNLPSTKGRTLLFPNINRCGPNDDIAFLVYTSFSAIICFCFLFFFLLNIVIWHFEIIIY